MSDVLAEIVATKREEIAAAKSRVPESDLRSRLNDAPPVRDFVAALDAARTDGGSGIGLIAEVKKASPSAGIIREDFEPVTIAERYAVGGAHCLSCLTDEHYFKGHLDYLTAIRRENPLPIMRKDFLLDPYQIIEARAAGADCVLLIAECLTDDELTRLNDTAGELGMARLIEIYDAENLDRVLNLSPALLGINNRNLRTFETTLDHTLSLADRVPEETRLISESGIRTHTDVARLQTAGIHGILVGESLMRQNDIPTAVRELLGTA